MQVVTHRLSYDLLVWVLTVFQHMLHNVISILIFDKLINIIDNFLKNPGVIHTICKILEHSLYNTASKGCETVLVYWYETARG